MSRRIGAGRRHAALNLLLAAALVFLAAGTAQSATVYWDINGATAGSGGPTPTGTWDTTTANWTTDSTGASATSVYTDGSDVIFSAGTDATGSYTVTVSGTSIAKSLYQKYGTLLLNGSGTISGVAGSDLTVTVDNYLTIGCGLAPGLNGTARNLIKSGTGTLELAGLTPMNVTGLTINSGTVLVSNGAAMPGTMSVNGAGGTLRLADTVAVNAVGGGGSSTVAINLGSYTLTIIGTNGGNTYIGGKITGSGALFVKAGGPFAVYNSNNDYTGGITLNPSALGMTMAFCAYGSASAASSTVTGGVLTNGPLGTGTVTFSGGTTNIQSRSAGGSNSTAPVTIYNNIVLAGNVGSGGLNFGGTVTFNSALVGGQATTFSITASGTSAQIYTPSNPLVINQQITGNGFTKTGASDVTIGSDSITWTGTAAVSAGRLFVNGRMGGGVVLNGGTLGGTGTVGGSVTATGAGTVAPGMSVGTLSTGNLSLAAANTLAIEVNGSTADQVNVTGTVALGSAAMTLTELSPATPGASFTIINNDGLDAVTGTFKYGGVTWADNTSQTVGSTTYTIHYAGGDGNDVTVFATPEPATVVLLLAGGLAAILRRRRA